MVSMSVSSVDTSSLISQLSTATSSSSTSTNDLDKQAFLNLLVAQLKYQDPLEPMENTEFVAQLAQFSNLEQLYDVNTNLQTNSLLVQSMSNATIPSLIGKEITGLSNTFSLDESGDSSFAYQIESSAEVTVAIYSSDGDLVRTLDMGDAEAGRHWVQWDGKNSSGSTMEAGEYYFEVTATDADGQTLDVETLIKGTVTGVRFEEGNPVILIGNLEIGTGDVVEVSGS
jgi:flagellar basal-body rod modification protein FlgD